VTQLILWARTARAGRHEARPRESPTARPLAAAVCSSIDPPDDEISDSLPASTRTPLPPAIPFTYGVPFPLQNLDPRQAKFLK
jgi:hypothetical protein